MPTRTRDYPIYTYDEPAVYKDFTGGINTDPSNEHLLNSELRDCVNMTYLSGALVKRKGAKKLCDISCDDDLNNIQGIFLFTYRITYLIIAADGKLYYGVFNDDVTINLTRLQIVRTKFNQGFVFDEENVFAGIEEKQPSEISGTTNHEGYIQTYFKNTETGAEVLKNERGSYFDVTAGAINVGDVFTETNYLYERKFLCIKTFEKTYEYPSDLHNWELVDGTGSTITIDGTTYYANEITPEEIASLLEHNVFNFTITNLKKWNVNDIVLYNSKFYRCVTSHENKYNSIFDSTLFVEMSALSTSKYVEVSYLLFQNYRKVEAATLNNSLYIATGTRIVEVYLSNNELRARPIQPYLCNYTEIGNLGYNYMSPYPELAVASQKNTVTTSMGGVKVQKTVGGRYLLTPVMNLQSGDEVTDYYYRWEKLVNGVWYVVVTFASQRYGAKRTTLEVDDADKFLYRCTFAKSFEIETTVVDKWSIEKSYNLGDYISVDAHVYKCLRTHTPETVKYINDQFNTSAYIRHVDEHEETSYSTELVPFWEEVFDIKQYPYLRYEMADLISWSPDRDFMEGQYIKIPFSDTVEKPYKVYRCMKTYSHEDYSYDNDEFSIYGKNSEDRYIMLWGLVKESYDAETFTEPIYETVYDYIINPLGDYFDQASTVLFNNDLAINDNFILIHSCTKIVADGNKLLFYGDRFNSGQWFKTIINNPGYVTDRGSLSFKTTKNESVVKVVPFQGNLIVFANSENVGGSIHLVQGNGDDYDDESGYYSPYQRRTINVSVSCSNPDSIQVCDNIIVFKYFNRVYYINASDLSNDTVRVNPCNDRILNDEGDVKIPWDDEDCISEVTRDYYSLVWKEKYSIDADGELILEHPGIRVKLYYKVTVQYDDNTFGMPWLRDESKIFNASHIIYIKGKPIYLYHNVLVSFDENYYKDLDEIFECKVHFKAVDCNYESFYKLIENCILGFHRKQFNNIDLNVIIKNEAGHVLLDSKSKRFAANDLGVLHVGKKYLSENQTRIGSTIQDTKMFITINKFPCLLVDTIVTASTDESFTLSSVTYSYTTIDMPDTNPSDTYKNIIRPED